MGYKNLLIWVEGPDDERFFDRIIKPILEKKYDSIKIIRYANMKKEKVDNFLKSIKSMKASYDYIFTTDINNTPCITAKKQEIQDKLSNIDISRIIVVIKEIESWYLAGSGEKYSKNISNTDSISKEQFNNFIPKKFDSRIDFMLEILKYFRIEMAKHKNKSFRYFVDKYNCNVFKTI